MKVRLFSVILALFLVILTATAQTGEQAGSVAIATTIRPAVGSESELDEYAECVGKMKVAGASYKEASKDCKDYRKVLAKESTRIANEAADATKASRPQVYGGYGRYGYGYGGYGYSRSYYSRPVIVRQAAPQRHVPQRRAAPDRTRPSR